MKKIICTLLALSLLVFSVGCAKFPTKTQNEKEKTTVKVAGLKGPTTMGIVKLLDDNEKGLTKNKYEYTMAVSADEITPLLLTGKIDIAAIPVNLASILYNKSGGKIQMLAVNTLGVIYIVENSDTVNSVNDLKGKTILATGKGTIPEFSLNHILAQNGITRNDVTVEWKSEPTEIVAAMKTNQNVIAMLPQPFVTVAGTQVDNFKIALDLTKEWGKADKDGAFVTSVIVLRQDFAKNKKQAVADFLSDYNSSVKYVNENLEDASKLIEKYDIVSENIANKAIPYCNLVCISNEKAEKYVQNFLSVLYNENPQSIGGKLPSNDFYYK